MDVQIIMFLKIVLWMLLLSVVCYVEHATLHGTSLLYLEEVLDGLYVTY